MRPPLVSPILFGSDHWRVLQYIEQQEKSHEGRLNHDELRCIRFGFNIGTPTMLRNKAIAHPLHDDLHCLLDLYQARMIRLHDLHTATLTNVGRSTMIELRMHLDAKLPLDDFNPTTTQPIDDFNDLISKFQQKPDYEGWHYENAADLIIELRHAIFVKNLDRLMALCHHQNQFSQKVFTRLTALSLPTNAAGVEQVLRTFVGTEIAAAYDREQAETAQRSQAARDQQQTQQSIQDRKHKFANQRVKYNGQIISKLDFMQAVIADGFTRLEEIKDGAVPRYRLWKEHQSFFDFKTKDEYEMLVELITAQNDSEPLPKAV